MDDLLAGRAPPPPPPKAKAPPPLAARAGEPAAIAAAKAAEEMPDPFAQYDKKGTGAATGQDVAPIHALAMSMEDLKPTDEELDADSFAEAIKKGEEMEQALHTMPPADDIYTPVPSAADVSPAAEPPAAAKPANGEIVFDKSVLGDLRNSIDKKSFDDMIKGLLDKADEIVVALGQAAASGDQKAMTARAHELKGMAGNFGLKELSSVAARAEKALKENQTAGLQELLDALPDANMRARTELEKWMAS